MAGWEKHLQRVDPQHQHLTSTKDLGNAQAMQQMLDAQGGLSSALSRLMVVVERYPDLKANQNFMDLQNQLEGTENRINVARQRYNQTVEAFNAKIRSLPYSLTNSLILHLDRKKYFKAEAGATQAPTIKFDKQGGRPLPMRTKCRLRSVGPILIFFLLVLAGAINASALEVPRLKGHVNDYAGMLSTASQRQLEAVLTDFERKESTQIVVLTIPSLQGDSLEDFSIRMAEAWKIGQAKLDNGAILLIVQNDRKIRIDVGYGLEGRLTDLLAGRIIRNVIAPQFKSGQFDRGITGGVAAMIDAVQGEYSVTDAPRQPRQSQTGVPIVALLSTVADEKPG